MSTSLLPEPELKKINELVIMGFVASVITFFFGIGAGYSLSQQEEPKVSVQMYVMAVNAGADVERYAIEQEGDQFTYPLSEDVLRRIQQTPFFAQCVDGLSITSVWTEFAENEACPGSPHIRVVLIAPPYD